MISILGASGFVGNSISLYLKEMGTAVTGFSSKDLDLLNEKSIEKNVELLNSSEVIVFASAKAPCKNASMLVENIRMVENLIKYVSSDKFIVYVSSDAVYADSTDPIDEESSCVPTSYHGLMHISREYMLREYFDLFGVVRPTLIYGQGDPHNGYGPNQFKRLAEDRKNILLFGKGEEKRDHVHISVVGRIIALLATRKITGVFNAVSGHAITFHQIAEVITKHIKTNSKIIYRPRSGPMPHNGYRVFNPEKVLQHFPEIVLDDFSQGIKNY